MGTRDSIGRHTYRDRLEKGLGNLPEDMDIRGY